MNYFYSSEDVKCILSQFENSLLKYSVVEYIINDFEKVIIIEDSLVLFVQMKEYQQGSFDNEWNFTNHCSYWYLIIDEVTYNNIGFKCEESYYIDYWKYHKDDIIDYIDAVLPNIQIKNRIDLWEGIKHCIVIYEIEDENGNIKRANAYTSRNANEYVNSICKKYIKTGIFSAQRNVGLMESYFRRIPKDQRADVVEKKLKYFYIEKDFRTKDDVWKYADKILELAEQHKLDDVNRYSYKHSVKRWKSEDIVFKLVSQIYNNYAVIPQHKPYFLRSSFGGQMSYDVYISKLNVAIEYQGKQHFEPVDFFGGQEAFEKQKIRFPTHFVGRRSHERRSSY